MRIFFVENSPSAGFSIIDGYYNAAKKRLFEVDRSYLSPDSVLLNNIFKFCRRYSLNKGWYSKSLLDKIIDFKPDVIICSRVDFISAQFLKDVKLSLPNCFLAIIYTDHPSIQPGVKYFPRLIPVLKSFDIVFSFSPSLVPVFYQLGARNVRHLNFAFCEETHLFEPCFDTYYQTDYAYIGSYGYIIENNLHGLNFHGSSFALYGNGWQSSSLLSLDGFRYEPGLGIGSSMHLACSGASVVLNYTRASHGCLSSMKTFELLASGALLLTNFSSDQYSIISEFSQVKFFNSKDELQSIIDGGFLRESHEIKSSSTFVESIHEFRNNNSYSNRLTEILNYYH